MGHLRLPAASGLRHALTGYSNTPSPYCALSQSPRQLAISCPSGLPAVNRGAPPRSVARNFVHMTHVACTNLQMQIPDCGIFGWAQSWAYQTDATGRSRLFDRVCDAHPTLDCTKGARRLSYSHWQQLHCGTGLSMPSRLKGEICERALKMGHLSLLVQL